MIDLRSDTVTRPTTPMKKAMLEAPLGDDVYGEDPTVNRLEALLAERSGKEAGLWLPSGTQANLVALMIHCRRGDEYIVGQTAHCYRHEGGGAAVCGGIQPQPLELGADGTLALDAVATAIKPDDNHFARTRLLCLENTCAGTPLPSGYLHACRELCRERGLQLHLDGARIYNAVVVQGTTLQELVRSCDSVSICLSKGLGAPAGSVLVGTADFISAARRWRKLLGGGMRQVGMLAAAGIYALEHHVDRLAEDHRRARDLFEGLRNYPRLNVEISSDMTNMVFCAPEPELMSAYQELLLRHGIKVGGYGRLRFVTHLDIDDDHVAQTLEATQRFFAATP